MHRHRGGDILIFAESLNDSQSIAELVLAVNPALGGRVRPRPRPTSLTRQAGTRAVARWVEDIRQAVVAHEAAGRHVAAVLVHRDADSADPDGEIAAKLKNQLASVGGHPVVPVQAIEAWWFLFPDAVEAVRPRAWRDLMPRRSRDVEGIVRPKDELARLTGQRARTPYSEADSPAIARNVNVHSGRRFDVVLANPPFNMSGWAGSGDSAQDVRWRYGVPPDHNANFAWLQHAVAMLAEQGRAAVLMANGAASTQDPQERAIRTAMINDGAVESIVALPPQLFHSTAIPVTLWLLRAPVGGSSASPVLFVDARATGRLVSRTRRVLTDDDIGRLIDIYQDWRGRSPTAPYRGVDGLARSVPLEEIRQRDYVLNPGRYVVPPSARPDLDSTARIVRELQQELDWLRNCAIDVDAQVDQQLRRTIRGNLDR